MVDITNISAPPIADIGTNQGWDLVQVGTSDLVIHSDTTDGSTTFADAVGTHSPTVGAADVEHDIAQKKWGKTSILFDGDSGYITTTDDHADWDFDSGTFTIDFWVRFATLPADTDIDIFMGQYVDGDNMWYVGLYNNGGTYILRRYVEEATAVRIMSKTWTTPVVDTWYHIALIRGWGGDGDDWAFTVNGVQIGTTHDDSNDMPNFNAPLIIGHQTGEHYFDGWMDEIRVDKGTARWENNFIPPYGSYR